MDLVKKPKKQNSNNGFASIFTNRILLYKLGSKIRKMLYAGNIWPSYSVPYLNDGTIYEGDDIFYKDEKTGDKYSGAVINYAILHLSNPYIPKYIKPKPDPNVYIFGSSTDKKKLVGTKKKVKITPRKPYFLSKYLYREGIGIDNIKNWLRKIGVKDDGIWGDETEAAYKRYMNNLLPVKALEASPLSFLPYVEKYDIKPKEFVLAVDKKYGQPTIRPTQPVVTLYDRSGTRDWITTKLGHNPYEYTGAQRRALRYWLNGDKEGLNYDKNLLGVFGNLSLYAKKGGILKGQEGFLTKVKKKVKGLENNFYKFSNNIGLGSKGDWKRFGLDLRDLGILPTGSDNSNVLYGIVAPGITNVNPTSRVANTTSKVLRTTGNGFNSLGVRIVKPKPILVTSSDVRVVGIPENAVPVGEKIYVVKNTNGTYSKRYFDKKTLRWIDVLDNPKGNIEVAEFARTSKPQNNIKVSPLNDVQIIESDYNIPYDYNNDIPYDYNNDIMMINSWDDAHNFDPGVFDLFKKGGTLPSRNPVERFKIKKGLLGFSFLIPGKRKNVSRSKNLFGRDVVTTEIERKGMNPFKTPEIISLEVTYNKYPDVNDTVYNYLPEQYIFSQPQFETSNNWRTAGYSLKRPHFEKLKERFNILNGTPKFKNFIKVAQ